jgi:hypothetical protein
VFLALLVLGAGLGLTSIARAAGASAGPAPPPAVLLFADAYARGDERGMRAASSLPYWEEAARAGDATPERRAAIRPPGLTFTTRGGRRAAGGFGHWLLSARVAGPAGEARFSVWRVDTTPADAVLWMEPVFIFNRCAEAVGDARARALTLPLPRGGAVAVRTILGVTCPGADQGYYLGGEAARAVLRYAAVGDGGVVPDAAGAPGGAGVLATDGLVKGAWATLAPPYLRSLDPDDPP